MTLGSVGRVGGEFLWETQGNLSLCVNLDEMQGLCSAMDSGSRGRMGHDFGEGVARENRMHERGGG